MVNEKQQALLARRVKHYADVVKAALSRLDLEPAGPRDDSIVISFKVGACCRRGDDVIGELSGESSVMFGPAMDDLP